MKPDRHAGIQSRLHIRQTDQPILHRCMAELDVVTQQLSKCLYAHNWNSMIEAGILVHYQAFFLHQQTY